jgi:hypothetical protein
MYNITLHFYNMTTVLTIMYDVGRKQRLDLDLDLLWISTVKVQYDVIWYFRSFITGASL